MFHFDTQAIAAHTLRLCVLGWCLMLAACAQEASELPSAVLDLLPDEDATKIVEPRTVFRTTAGGKIVLARIRSISVPDAANLKAVKGAGDRALYFFFDYSSSGAGYKLVRRYDLVTETFSDECRIASDDILANGFEIDDSRLYITRRSYQSFAGSIQIYERAPCRAVGQWVLNIELDDYMHPTALSRDESGVFYMARFGLDYLFDPTTQQVSTFSTGFSIGQEIFNADSSLQIRAGVSWGLDWSQSEGVPLLWRRPNRSGAGYAQLISGGEIHPSLAEVPTTSLPQAIPLGSDRVYVTVLKDFWGRARSKIDVFEFETAEF